MTPEIRPLKLSDLPAIEEIQKLNPSSAQWNPADYLGHETRVVEIDSEVAAFMAIQMLPPFEAEIYNIAVHPKHKRHGLATALLQSIQARRIFLDVRESNAPALAFYRKHGFTKCGHRRKYYSRPTEDAIMMSRG
jgi:[ribosomal protein S18]-alanine N-acetyltransferase